MDRRSQALAELKESFKKILKFADEAKFNNFVLEDGTQITVKGQDIAPGIEVMQLDENQNAMPLNPGDYTLQDGRTFTVDSTNKITEVSAPDDSDDEAASGEDTDNVETSKQTLDADGLPAGHDGDPKTGEDVQPDTQSDGDMSSRIEDLEKQIAEIVNFLQQLQNSQQEVNEQMMHKIKRIGSESDIEPIVKTNKGYEVYKSKDKKTQSEDITSNFLDKIRKIKMEKTPKVETKQNGLKKLLASADSQIKKQTMSKVESKTEAAKPTNVKTESLLDRIRTKNKK